MSDLSASIGALPDSAAERLLATLARHRLKPAAGDVSAMTPEVARALAEATEGPSGPVTGTAGDLARTTLLLLAEDPERQGELRALVENPPPEKLAAGPVTLALLGTAALVALQTYVKIEYDETKGLRVKVERQPLDKALLGQVVGLLSRLFTHA